MSYGDASRGGHPWALAEQDAAPFFRQAVDLGITFWDTANVYNLGSSEEYVGRAIDRYTRRADVVLATKVHGRMHGGPGGAGLSRRAILEQVDASLRRLGTDHIDLYQVHRFDPDAPVEETMEALHDVVKAGKARYLGASSMWAWQFAKMQHAAGRGLPMAQIALAWVLHHPVVDAPIVGATKAHHLVDAVAALEIELTAAEVEQLQAAYTPRHPTGLRT
jgi:aryl-alcohol dehydrogenase-like predicted oxidoreductase